jgi:cytochrome b561
LRRSVYVYVVRVLSPEKQHDVPGEQKMSRPVTISREDILLIITGVALIMLGGLLATIYAGVAALTTNLFEEIAQTELVNYATEAAKYVPLILNMLGLALIIAAVAHIIAMLYHALRAGTTAPTGV